MKNSYIRRAFHLIAHILSMILILGVFAACAHERVPEIDLETGSTTETPKDPSDEIPDATTHDDMRISFFIATDEESKYIYEVHGNHFDPLGNRFFDADFYMVYRFPAYAEHKTMELIVNLANQYEVSASSDGENYEVIASSTDVNQGSEKLILDLSDFRPTEGEGYVYVRLGDADTSDGWGGCFFKDTPLIYFSGVSPCSIEAEQTIRAGNNVMYRYDLTPGGDTERAFILRDNSVLADMGANPFHLCDASHDIVYAFRGVPGQLAYVTMDISQEYLIEVSTDNNKYEEIVNYTQWGRYRDLRSIDLSQYFAKSKTVFLRISDYTTDNGWGAQIRDMSYTVLMGGSSEAASMTINNGWHVRINDTVKEYTAGEVIKVPEGTAVTFEKVVTVPADYVASRGISFAYIEGSAEKTTVTVDGEIADHISKSANALTVALPDGLGDNNQYVIRVSTVAGASGKVGLWRNVRLGMADMISYPETESSFGDTVRPFNRAAAPYDQVSLNFLAGNFLQSLYNAKLGINAIDTSMKVQQLYYVGDTARALIGVAYEEIYSPIVRLEYAIGMYKGILKAAVPTSDIHCFLKYDSRPKRVTQNGNSLLWQNVQDVREPFADMYLLPDGAALDEVTLSYVKGEEDADFNGSAKAVSACGDASVLAQINWYNGTSDRATTVNLRAEGCDGFQVMLRFDNYDAIMNHVAADGEILAENQRGNQPVKLDVTNAYFIFDRLNWNANGIVVATDIRPISAYIIPSEDGTRYAAVVLKFGAEDRPNITAVRLNGISTDLKYAYYVAEHLTEDFTYGCNGYDPSFLADYSAGALAAGAYLMKKYNVDGWEQSIAIASEALKKLDAEIAARSYIPSVWQSSIAGCHFMTLAGEDTDTYRELASKWADMIVADQAYDGTYSWLDSRNPIATLIAYDITGKDKYLQSARRWMEAVEYTDKGVFYRGELYEGPSFNGTGDMILMNRFGYDDPLAKVLALESARVDDSGFFACSDINPYYLGYSLADLMDIEYGIDKPKKILFLGQYVAYEADGSCTVYDRPDVYVNNPFGAH